MKNNKTFLNELDQEISSFEHQNKNIEKHDLTKNKIDLKKVWENSQQKEQNDIDFEFEKAKELERLLQKDKKEALIRKRNTLVKIFSIAILIIISTIIYFITKDYINNNSLKTDNVSIEFANPSSISGFKPFSINLKIENNIGEKITDSKLVIFYPEGTLDGELENELHREEYTQKIENNSTVSYKERLAFLGPEYSDKKIKYEFDYKIKGDKKSYKKTGLNFIRINTSPVALNISYDKHVNSGVPEDIVIEVKSNSDEDINGISVIADLDNSFHLNNSIPEATLSNNIFYFEKLKSGETKKIKLNGYFTGLLNEEKHIKVRLLKNIPKSKSKILSIFGSENISFKITEKDLDLAILARRNKNNDIVFKPVLESPINIHLKNKLSEAISNVKIRLSVPELFFDEYSVTTMSGFYDSNNDFILWDKNINSSLTTINSNESVQVDASLKPIDPINFSGIIKNPIVDMWATVSATNDSLNSKTISYKESFKIKLDTIFKFSEKAFKPNGEELKHYNSDYIPVVGEPKRYTIKWYLSSSTNDILSPKVEAFIPHYSKIISNDRTLSYNKKDRILTWRPEKIKAFSGYNDNPPKEIEFILEYTPTVKHSSVPTLIRGKKITGLDAHTQTNYTFSSAPLSYPNSVDHKGKNK